MEKRIRKKFRRLAWPAFLALMLLFPALPARTADDVTLDELAEVMPELKQALDSVRLRKNPRLLNGVSISGKRLPKLILKNVSLRDATFKQCSLPELHLEDVSLENFRFEGVGIDKASFKNVRFVNCVFDGTRLAESELENCLFQGGQLRRNKYGDYGGYPDFNKNRYREVVFDGVAFKNGFYTGNSTGSMAFRNIENPDGTPSYEGRPLVHGQELRLEFDGCAIGKISFLSVWNDSTVRVINSSFRGSDISVGQGVQISFENCSFSGDTTLDAPGTVLMKDCTAKAGVQKRQGVVLDIRGGDFAAQ